MITWTIFSVKAVETIRGTLTDAIERANEHLNKLQPAFGVQIEDENGNIVWDSENIAKSQTR